ncbi:hypothetical protein [Acinetobacter calcoaceticus]|uniref:Defence against restriction A N-terminal domain-containing protein n=1 Tax=Acinetobacter calcoaceticus TaxID=471 RepID=A0ABD5ALE6_ACICA|nr:hypothetical protein [Acinetobacter calcoaceticus]MDP9803260.1 hypothetical protein [Acinetobacter calcoaceticus]
MTKLISTQDAFNALISGKVILCRHIDGEFDTLDQFPATVFSLPGYEYCIQLPKIELAGITFTQPLTLDDVKPDQDIYLIEPTGSIYWYKFNETAALKNAITNGFAQENIENARLQLKAFCAAIGRDVDTSETPVVPIGGADKQKTGKKKTTKAASAKQVEETKAEDPTHAEVLGSPSKNDTAPQLTSNLQHQVLLDALKIANSEQEVENVCSGLEKEGFTQEQLDEIEVAKQTRLTELDFIEMDTADTATEHVFSVLYDSFISEIESCTSAEELKAVKNKIGANGHLEDQERENLMEVIRERTFSDKAATAPKAVLIGLIDQADTLDELSKVNNTILASSKNLTSEDLSELKIHCEQRKEQLSQLDLIDSDPVYPAFTYSDELVDELAFEIVMAVNAEEVNAIFDRTRQWSEAQRKPLLDASYKRLNELKGRPLIERIHAAQNIDVLRALFAEIRLLENGTQKYEAMTAYKNREAQLPGAPMEISQ